MNRILEDMLRHYVNPRGTDWDEFLPAVEFAVNNAWQESVRATPFFLNYIDIYMEDIQEDPTVHA
jgi:hypothetical protein